MRPEKITRHMNSAAWISLTFANYEFRIVSFGNAKNEIMDQKRNRKIASLYQDIRNLFSTTENFSDSE